MYKYIHPQTINYFSLNFFQNFLYLLEGIHALQEDVVPGDDHEDGDGRFHKGEGSVLSSPAWIHSLCM